VPDKFWGEIHRLSQVIGSCQNEVFDDTDVVHRRSTETDSLTTKGHFNPRMARISILTRDSDSVVVQLYHCGYMEKVRIPASCAWQTFTLRIFHFSIMLICRLEAVSKRGIGAGLRLTNCI
jgi:hypothetical protein